MSLKIRLILLVCALGLLAAAYYFLRLPALDQLHKGIVSAYPNVTHIKPDEFRSYPADSTVVFDVREFDEYQVSHIKRALQLSPDIDPDEFEERYSNLLLGKHVVFYCSVGWRSSELADRLGGVAESLGAMSSVNLKGGLFNWVNQGYELNGTKLHPYNDYWSLFIDDKKKISYQ